MHTHPRPNSRAHTHIRIHTHARPHTYANTRTHALTHVHTHKPTTLITSPLLIALITPKEPRKNISGVYVPPRKPSSPSGKRPYHGLPDPPALLLPGCRSRSGLALLSVVRTTANQTFQQRRGGGSFGNVL